MQLSVVMRPLPHSVSLGHKKSATPTLGFSAAPAEGSRRKLGGSAPSPLKCLSLWIRQRELPIRGSCEKNSTLARPLLHVPTSAKPPSYHLAPCSLLGHGIGVPGVSSAVLQGWGHRDQEPIIASGL